MMSSMMLALVCVAVFFGGMYSAQILAHKIGGSLVNFHRKHENFKG